MSKSAKGHPGKAFKLGQKAPTSGIYAAIGPRGGRTVEQTVVVNGKPLPPVPKSAKSYTLRAKSGRYIIQSPAQSANTVVTWSRAFKKK
jgi:hypothetical protein